MRCCCAFLLAVAVGNVLLQASYAWDKAMLPIRLDNPNNTWSKFIGSSYIPSSVSGNIEFFVKYYSLTDEINFELSTAQQYLGINSLRMFLHPALFERNSTEFLGVMDHFMSISAKYGMQVGWVFFDDAWGISTLNFTNPCLPCQGCHNMCNQMAPQWEQRESHERYKPYIVDTVTRFAGDKRIAFWDIFNEPIKPKKPRDPPQTRPNQYSDWSFQMRHLARQWIREIAPGHLVISNWPEDVEDSDCVNTHYYSYPIGTWKTAWQGKAITDGAIITEAGGRNYAGHPFIYDGPLRVVYLVKQLKAIGSVVPGIMPCWELMVGNTNTRWHWYAKAVPGGKQEPVNPWHGHFFPDGTPVSFTEAAAMYELATGVERRIYYEDYPFKNTSKDLLEQGFLCLGKGEGGEQSSDDYHLIPAGDLGDFLLEVAIMPHNASTPRNANLTNLPFTTPCVANFSILFHRSGADYYDLSFTSVNGTQTLQLFRVSDHFGTREALGTFDVDTMDAAVQPRGFNMFRIAMRGSKIQVWLNPLWTDVVSGPYGNQTVRRAAPRIEYDDPSPLPAGESALVVYQGYTEVQYISVLNASLLGWLDQTWASRQRAAVPVAADGKDGQLETSSTAQVQAQTQLETQVRPETTILGGSGTTTTQSAADATPEQPATAATSAQPVADATAAQPAADATSEQPAVDATSAQPAADTTSAQPNVDGTAAQPADDATSAQPNVDATSAQPAVGTTSAQPNVDATAAQPNVDATSAQPAAGATSAQPNVDATAAQPATDATSAQPNVDATSAQPSVDATAAQPAADATSAQPNIDATSAQPAADATSAQPNVDATSAQPAADATSAQPNVDATAAQPVADATSAQPNVDGTAAQPAADATSAQPAVDSTPEQAVVDATSARPGADATSAQPGADTTSAQPGADATSAQPGADAMSAQPIDANTEQPAADAMPAQPTSDATTAERTSDGPWEEEVTHAKPPLASGNQIQLWWPMMVGTVLTLGGLMALAVAVAQWTHHGYVFLRSSKDGYEAGKDVESAKADLLGDRNRRRHRR